MFITLVLRVRPRSGSLGRYPRLPGSGARPSGGVVDLTIKLGVLALAGPENGGTYQYTLSVLQALRHTSGFEMTVYGDPQNSDLIGLGYPIRRFAESRAQQVVALAAHRMHIRLADQFASEDILLAPIYSLALLHTSKPFAFTLHDLQENYYPQNFPWWQRAWRHQVNSQMLLQARRVICESRQVQMDVTRAFGKPEEQTAVIAAPPLRQFLDRQSDDKIQMVRARLQLPEKFLFYPAQFWVHKNHLRLIEAFKEVAAEVPDVNLVLTGKPRPIGHARRRSRAARTSPEYQAVMSAIEQFGLNERVLHLGYVEQDDLQAIYRLATALVMPSLFESVSIPIYEAFQIGTPVAASGILAIPEQVGDAGLLFDPTSVASIKQAILKILGDPEAARLLANRGRDRMLTMTPQRFGAQLQALLNQLR
jgi:glycosyltransferase involved in cell wall biosynthesis